MRFNLPLSAAKNYFLGFATSGLFLVSGLYFFNAKKTPEDSPINFTESLEAENLSATKTQLSAFNPNELNEEEWRSLGFSERQVATILKYKSVVGGNFNSKEQLRKCYAISAEKFEELEPFLLLPAQAGKSNYYQNYSNNSSRKNAYSNYSSTSNRGLTIPGKFNPDTYSVTDFIKLGFTERQSTSILKYKNYLGGSFISKAKFKECYMISAENYRKLEPYLLLPETGSGVSIVNKNHGYKSSSFEKPTVTYSPFDPNSTNLEGWKALGFSEKQAQVIINYRDKNLKGSFKSLDDIARCFVISAEKFEQLKPYMVLSAEMNNPKELSNLPQNQSSKTEVQIDSKTDFRKTNLNEITFKQLIEFGFDEKAAGSFIGFRKKLGGFITKSQIMETYNIDKDLTAKLIATAPLLIDQVPRYTFMDAPESWLKSHPYFKYYADKIIYYRITYSNENKFFRTMNIKPEAEQKMKLYLK